MAKMIFVNKHCYDDSGENQTYQRISINADQIIKIEKSRDHNNAKSVITFHNSINIEVMETVMDLTDIINK